MPLVFQALSRKAAVSVSAHEFLRECLLLDSACVYRGHGSKDWPLVPGAFRESSSRALVVNIAERRKRLTYYSSAAFDSAFEQLERLAAEREGFKTTSTGYGLVQKLVFLQHFGVPTPLLDWSDSPLIALFMGWSFRPAGSKYLRIWKLDPSKLPAVVQYQNYESFGFNRARRQLGGISFCGKINQAANGKPEWNEKIFGEIPDIADNESILGWVDVSLAAGADRVISDALKVNGITHENLFPDSSYWAATAIKQGLGW